MQNYHLQLPPPYNHIIIGGAKPLTVHKPDLYVLSDAEDKQFPGVPEFYADWPESDIAGWKGKGATEYAKKLNEGGVWSGGESETLHVELQG